MEIEKNTTMTIGLAADLLPALFNVGLALLSEPYGYLCSLFFLHY